MFLVRGESDHAEPPGFESGAPFEIDALLRYLQIGILEHILGARHIPTAAVERPAESIRVQSFEVGGQFLVHSFATEWREQGLCMTNLQKRSHGL
jgi:hypothetical protein